MHRTCRYQVENLYILLENQGKGFRHAQVWSLPLSRRLAMGMWYLTLSSLAMSRNSRR